MKTKEKLACWICGYDDISARGGHREFVDFQIQTCLSCKLYFVSPAPDENFLLKYYRQQYRENENNLSFYYRETQRFRAESQYRYLTKILGNHFFRNKACLDIGCGMGVFLNKLREKGAAVKGFDPRKKLISYGKERWNLPIFTADIGSYLFGENQFDLISLSHVLEHLRDPIGRIRQIIMCLKKGGYLFIEVPNNNSEKISWQLDVRKKTDEHLTFFNKENVQTFLKNKGLKIIHVTTCGRPLLGQSVFDSKGSSQHDLPVKKELIVEKKKKASQFRRFLQLIKMIALVVFYRLENPWEKYYPPESDQEGNWIRLICQK